MKPRGLTLMEIVFSVGLMAVIAVGALSIYPALFDVLTVNSQKLIAWEVAKREMESLKNTSFDTLMLQAYDPGSQQPVAYAFPTDLMTKYLPQGSGVYYIERMHDKDNNLISGLLKIETVVCLKAGRRILGEDLNLNGILDTGEDSNNDHKITSPIDLTTLIMKK